MKQITRVVLVFLFGLGCISCGEQPESNVTEELPEIDTEITSGSDSDESPSEEPEPEAIEEPLTIPDKPLSGDGPWLIINSTQGLFALNPDGSGLTQFSQSIAELSDTEQITAAPRGGYIAYHETSWDEDDTTIHIIAFPSLELVAEIPLFTYGDEPDWNAERAIQEYQSMVFSPDGSLLAFMGVIEGPTSDLYQYSIDSKEILQLTSGRTQGYQPVWSPDGKYILHTGTDGFGTGAGFETKGIWTAQADTDNVKTLYTPTPNAAEMIVGWLNDETFVVYSWSQPCGSGNLRTYNVESKQSTILWSESFQDIAMDPLSGTIVLISDGGECAPEGGEGTYFIPVFGGDSQKVSAKTGPVVVWSPEGENFIVSGGSFEEWVIGVNTFGQIVEFDRPSDSFYLPVLSPSSNYLFWSGKSPHIGTIDNSIPTIPFFNESIQNAVWTLDGQAIIFIADSGLYIAHQPDFKAIMISPDFEMQYTDDFMDWLYP